LKFQILPFITPASSAIKNGERLEMLKRMSSERGFVIAALYLRHKLTGRNMKNHPEWISITDSLPIRGDLVLGVNKFYEMKVCYRDKPWADLEEEWFVDLIGVFYPTHWMPLPQVPK
jgi:hypothetical protein